MGAPQRYSDGVTNIGKAKTLSEMPMLDPTKTYGVFDDFFTYAAADWENDEDGTGTELISATETGGVLVLTTEGAQTDDFNFVQYSEDGGTTPSTTFLFALGKKAWFKARLKLSETTANISSWTAGLYINNEDPIASNADDGVWFESATTSTDVDLYITKGGSDTVVAGAFQCVSGTYLTLGFYWDGIDTIHYFKDDVLEGSVGVGTSLPDDATCAISFGLENGEAAANAMHVDYIGAWMER